MKKHYEGNILNPLPVALVGTLINGRPNYCVIGYITPFNFGKHVFFSLYKKRYTWSGIEANKTFSVNIPSDNLMKEVRVCGSKSGRDVDKIAHTGLTPVESESGAVFFDEARLVVECRKIYIHDLNPKDFLDANIEKEYPEKDYHRMYTGEIKYCIYKKN